MESALDGKVLDLPLERKENAIKRGNSGFDDYSVSLKWKVTFEDNEIDFENFWFKISM